ncbi:MAG: AMP-binding protein [Ardenticatenaceae bacterium]|nr:AMP-binding protein [Ardenticatenaceae bacterium]
MNNPQTIPQYFLKQVQVYGAGKVALRQKEFGIWREFSWQESYENVKLFALGLLALGVQRGDKVCTIGDNDRQYLWGYIGLLAVGATQVGVYTDAIAKEVAYIAGHSDSTFAMAKDQEQCDKMLEIRSEVPHIKKVIYWEDKGLWNYDDPWLISFEEVQELGRAVAEKESDRFETEVSLGQGEDTAVLCYTSGTTGLPKGAMLSHHNLISSTRLFNEVDPRYPDDNHVSILPLGWIGEHALGIAPHVFSGIVMNFPEEPETVRENIREIAPEGLLYNSRLWENIVGMVQVSINESSWLNRKLYQQFLPVGYQVADKRLRNETVGPGLNLAYKLGNLTVFGPLRDKLGLSRIRAAYTAGSALSPDAMRFFHALGINLKQVYGSTELTGGATLHRDGDIKFASVGKPIPESEAKIGEDGEIMLTGPILFQGYYKNPEATEKSLWVDEDGRSWFRTGDAGYIDEDGHIIYLDRVNEMLTLANGEKFSPQFIEGRLKFSPYIRDVMAVGTERDFVTALIVMDYGNVGNWAERRGVGYTTFIDLSQKQEVYDLIQKAVAEVNESLPPNGRVRRFVLMHKEFDADEEEMTRSRKLKRNVLYTKYDDIITGLYNGSERVEVRATVQYQDGSTSVVETAVKIASLY